MCRPFALLVGCERDAKPLRQACEIVTAPAVAKREGDRDHVRKAPHRDAIDAPDDLREEIVGTELLDEELHEGARPRELPCALGKLPHRTGTKLLPPLLGIELLRRPDGIFELAIDVDDYVTDLGHGCTSTSSARIRALVVRVGLGRPASV